MQIFALFCLSYLDIFLIGGVLGYIYWVMQSNKERLKVFGKNEGKKIFITGGSSGIGKELAIQYSHMEAYIIITGRDEQRLKETKQACAHPDRVTYYVLDMEDPEKVKKWCQEKRDEIGTLDVLIHNAGLSMRAKLLDTEISLGEKLLNVDFLSVFAMTKEFLPIMNTKEQGSVICAIGSLSGVCGSGYRSIYAGTKAAIDGFFKSLACETKADKIHTMVVHPGYVQTNVSQNSLVGDGKQSFGKTDKNIKNGISVERCSQQIIDGIALRKTEVWVSHSYIVGILLYIGRLFPTIMDMGIYKNLKSQESAVNQAE